jgi:regulatory protein
MTTGRSTSNASDPWARALRLLSRRDRSTAELTAKLKQDGFSAAQIEATLDKCREYNYLDDHRYALERARSLMRSGRGVGRKILGDLRQRGIDETTADRALQNANQEFDRQRILHDLLERRFPDFNVATAPANERQRVIHYLQRRGFPLEQIFTALDRFGED